MPARRVPGWALLVASVALGSGIAAVDALPTWDDTGITAAALVLATAAAS